MFYTFVYFVKMEKRIVIKILSLIFRFLLGGLLVFAGVLKVIDNTTLFEAVAYITWIPVGLKSLVIDFLPWIEIVAGSLLILHLFDKLVIPVNGLIYLSFFLFTIWGLSSGIEMDCGCFGELDKGSFLGSLLGSEISWQMMIRNAIFTLMAGFVYWHSQIYNRS
ncbi:MAG: hypothetical protein EA360_05010 [Balneolaceae bacterium]|nr:MAG: hypothetical protein EA360_05010 [Balneolaceae bacterium]